MTPDLSYGQIMPSEHVHPGHGGFIEWSQSAKFLDNLILFELGITHQVTSGRRQQFEGAWTPQDSTALSAWFDRFLAYIQSPPAQGERKMANNHGSWYDTVWQSVAHFAGNATANKLAAEEVIQVRIPTQILPDGREWIELERAAPAGYCMYNLLALTVNADLARFANTGVDIWNYETKDGRSLKKAIDWLLPYALNEKPWPYKQIEPAKWSGLHEVTRLAGNAYLERSYEVITYTV